MASPPGGVDRELVVALSVPAHAVLGGFDAVAHAVLVVPLLLTSLRGGR